MEKASGVLLSDIWHQMKRYAKYAIIRQLVDIQKSLSSKHSTMHGVLFYRKDISSGLSGAFDRIFTIGPLVHPTLWPDGRSESDICKGPC